MSTVFRVGMSELKTATPKDVLMALGLGSCVGVCMYDPLIKLGGMAHIMLPDSSQARELSNPGKFADTAIPALLELMEKNGALRRRLIVKIVGGAQMFSISGNDPRLNIGSRNVTAVEEALAKYGLKIAARSVGGNLGKTITLDTETGIVNVKTFNCPVFQL
ncbi:MAG TPA: chemotaxis protein CheD [Firmicutes bacterium]|jgi:chemotaxis protein CheD|nr:chemotaxis protein CheD [Bacillota bacterium]HPT67276.1 chemotaxis protein CheD [Bacillota bacterium]